MKATSARSLEHARIKGSAGIARAAERADRDSPAWIDRALSALREFAAAQYVPFTIDRARDVIKNRLDQPAELRAWGAVTLMAMRRGYIVKTDRTAPAASSNGSAKPLFKRGPKA